MSSGRYGVGFGMRKKQGERARAQKRQHHRTRHATRHKNDRKS
jgi:hypothetical protein